MPFPPNFDNVWDITQPPDTQLANLLGQDIRNLKDDVMQRMSLISGTLANRPTPETVNSTWGGVGFGLLYFATDNGKIYQWTGGGGWVDVTANFIPSSVTPPPRTFFKDNALHNHTGTTTQDTIYTIPVTANSMGANGIVRCNFSFVQVVQSGFAPSLVITFGGVSTGTITLGTNVGTNVVYFTLSNRGATNSQIFNLFIAEPLNNINTSSPTLAVDTTVAQNILIKFQQQLVGDSQTFNQCFAELL